MGNYLTELCPLVGSLYGITLESTFDPYKSTFSLSVIHPNGDVGVVPIEARSDFLGAPPIISDVAIVGNVIYLVGDFTIINGVNRNGLAAIDFYGRVLNWNPGIDGSPRSILIANNKIYVGGLFNNIGGAARFNLAEFSLTTGAVTAWAPTVDGEVRFLETDGTKLYVAGSFSSIGIQPRAGLAAFDLGTGTISPWNPNPIGPSSEISSLSYGNNQIYVSGPFEQIGGQARPYVAALDPVTGNAGPFTFTWSSLVTDYMYISSGLIYPSFSLIPRDGMVYVIGALSEINGQSRFNYARVDGTTGALDATFDLNPGYEGNFSDFLNAPLMEVDQVKMIKFAPLDISL